MRDKNKKIDLLRKVMTITAIAGAVLVTGVFCYLPIHTKLLAEHRQSISLSEAQLEAEQMAAESNQAGDTPQTGDTNQTDAIPTTQTGVTIPEIGLELIAGENSQEVKLWKSREGICYFFLPSFANASDIRLSYCEDGGYLKLGNTTISIGDSLKDITMEQPYTMVAYNRKEEAVLQAQIVFMQSQNLPSMSIETQSGSLAYIQEVKGNAESGNMKVYDSEGTLLHKETVKELRGRGNSTWGLLKKPYQMKLDENTDLFGFGKAKDWNLLANGYDETGIRNQIVYDMAASMGMAYTPQGQLVDLYCNGEYQGVYYLCEKVQISENRVDLKDMESETEQVYRNSDFSKLEQQTSPDMRYKWVDVEYNPTDLTGGYLIERELDSRYVEELSGFITDDENYYAIDNPKHASKEQVEYIYQFVQAFETALDSPDGINRETGKAYSDYIDMDSFVGKYLIEEISKNYDGDVTSAFYYKPQDSVSTKLFAGPVWDYDVAFGNCNLDGIASNPMGITKLANHVLGTQIYSQLYEKEEFRQQAIKTYKEEVRPYLQELLDTGIDAYSIYSRQAILMNNLRWEELENRYLYYEDYDNNLQYLKYFIQERMDFLDEVWLEGVAYHCISFQIDGEAWRNVYVLDGELPGEAPIPTRQSSLFCGWFTEPAEVPYDVYKPVYEDMTFHARWQELNDEDVTFTE